MPHIDISHKHRNGTQFLWNPKLHPCWRYLSSIRFYLSTKNRQTDRQTDILASDWIQLKSRKKALLQKRSRTKMSPTNDFFLFEGIYFVFSWCRERAGRLR